MGYIVKKSVGKELKKNSKEKKVKDMPRKKIKQW